LRFMKALHCTLHIVGSAADQFEHRRIDLAKKRYVDFKGSVVFAVVAVVWLFALWAFHFKPGNDLFAVRKNK